MPPRARQPWRSEQRQQDRLPIQDAVRTTLLIAFFGLATAGFVKGATGIGQALIAVPILAISLGLRPAVLVALVSTLVINSVQLWTAHRTRRGLEIAAAQQADREEPRPRVGEEPGAPATSERLPLVIALGVIGTIIGTRVLYVAPPEVLTRTLGVVVGIYVLWKVRFPGLSVSDRFAVVLTPVAAVGTGLLQGATGAGGPVIASYLHARGLPRVAFLRLANSAFQAFALTQLMVLVVAGAYTGTLFAYSLAALIPLGLGFFTGEWVGRRFGERLFDPALHLLLAVIALNLIINPTH